MPARLRMNVIGNPGIDKLDFELLSLAVSAVNGCGLCVTAHETQAARRRRQPRDDPERGTHRIRDSCGRRSAGVPNSSLRRDMTVREYIAEAPGIALVPPERRRAGILAPPAILRHAFPTCASFRRRGRSSRDGRRLAISTAARVHSLGFSQGHGGGRRRAARGGDPRGPGGDLIEDSNSRGATSTSRRVLTAAARSRATTWHGHKRPQLRLPVIEELGRPEHNEFRWVDEQGALKLVSARVVPIIEWAAAKIASLDIGSAECCNPPKFKCQNRGAAPVSRK